MRSITDYLLVALVGCAVAKHYLIETIDDPEGPAYRLFEDPPLGIEQIGLYDDINERGSGGNGDSVDLDPAAQDAPVMDVSPPPYTRGKNGKGQFQRPDDVQGKDKSTDYNARPSWGFRR
uniref:Secreted protein n=1 Tax=Pseudodiaptomus poplesia TaxID=213370 RepID=A0A0U2T5F9_9MAXI|nr:hypothetical protein [Pseudodiaptomus poplesia]